MGWKGTKCILTRADLKANELCKHIKALNSKDVVILAILVEK